MSDDPVELLSTPETARRLGITTREVYDLVEAGRLPMVRTKRGPAVPADAMPTEP